MSLPPFSLTASRDNQKTFMGRYMSMMRTINPAALFYTKKQLQEINSILQRWGNGERRPEWTDAFLWKSRDIRDNSFAQDGTIIPRPFRMCGYIPTNVIICVGMLTPSPALGVFCQWMNQNQNAALNHFNRPSKEPTTLKQFLKGYLPAASASVAVGWGLNSAVTKSNISPAIKAGLLRAVPFFAAASANAVNIGFMRMREISTGIPVTDAQGNQLGLSKVAARRAVALTAFSRIIMSGSLLTPPPFIMNLYSKTQFAKAHPGLYYPMYTLVMGALFALALPLSTGVFPQQMSIKTSKLEPEFHKYEKEGKDTLYFNKGL